MIVHNSHARREKEIGEVKREYGEIWGEEEGNTYSGEWRGPVSKMSHHMKKGHE